MERKLAGAEGFEPPTIGFGDRCSTNWNYAPAVNGGLYVSLIKGKAFFTGSVTTGDLIANLKYVIAN